MMGEEDDYTNYNLYDSHSLAEDAYSDLGGGKVGVIVYDDLKNPHLVEADPGTILSIRSPGLQDGRSLHFISAEKYLLHIYNFVFCGRSVQSEERSSGDGGSDRGCHYDKLVAGPAPCTAPFPAPCSAPGTPQYATVARRLQGTAVYSELQRRPDGER